MDDGQDRTMTDEQDRTTRDERTPTGTADERTTTGSDGTLTDGARADTLLDVEERDDLRERWDRIQTRFVDDPETATREADELLSTTLDRVAERWQQRHRALRREWNGDDEASTERLRTVMKRYRDAFERLVTY